VTVVSLVAVLRGSVGTTCIWLLSCVTDVVNVERSVLTTINEDVMLCYKLHTSSMSDCFSWRRKIDSESASKMSSGKLFQSWPAATGKA